MLGVKCCRSLFAKISGCKVKAICVLNKNLKEVTSWSKDTKSNSSAEIDFSRPIFVTQAAMEAKTQRKRTIEPTKEGNLKKAKGSPETVANSTDDLVEKVVDHFCYLDDDVEEERRNRGAVIEKAGSS